MPYFLTSVFFQYFELFFLYNFYKISLNFIKVNLKKFIDMLMIIEYHCCIDLVFYPKFFFHFQEQIAPSDLLHKSPHQSKFYSFFYLQQVNFNYNLIPKASLPLNIFLVTFSNYIVLYHFISKFCAIRSLLHIAWT